MVAWALVLAGLERLELRAVVTAENSATVFTSSFETLYGHINGVVTEPEVRRAFDAGDDPQALASMATAFTTLLTRNARYYQVRWIDEGGRERVRMERGPDGAARRSALLQDKSDRYYVRDGLQEAPGAITFSALDLNVEGGRVQIPRVPTVRIVTRVADGRGKPAGLVVINVHMQSLFDEVRAIGVDEGVELSLLNRRGEWLLGPDEADEFAFMDGRDVTLAQREPAVWARIVATPRGDARAGGVWAWTQIDPGAPRADAPRDNQTPWIFLAHVDADAVGGLYPGVLVPTALLTLLILGMFGGLSWRLALERAQLAAARDEAEVNAKARWLASEIATAANSASTAEEMIHLCLRPICEATQIGIGMVMLGEEIGIHYIADSDDRDAIDEALVALEASVWIRDLRHSTAPEWIDLHTVSPSEGEDSWRRLTQRAGIHGILGIPLVVDGEAIASCVLLYAPSSRTDRAALEAIVDAAWSSLAAQVSRVQSRERAAQALLREREAAEAASRAKGDFLASVSHELRTPLNGILGITELLLRRPLGGRDREYVELIWRSGTVLLALTNDVLDLSKIEAKKLDLEALPLSPAQVLDDVASTMRPQAEAKGLALRLEGSGPLPSVLGDPTRLRQVLYNLVGNAIKFTDRGEVTVAATEVGRDGEIATLHFVVRDSGVGLDAGAIEGLFRPYHQADASTARRYGGTGLGLAISKELVELMGGHIGVQSRVGVGSTFWFDLPLKVHVAAVEADTARDEVREAEVVTRAFRLLVAEDNPINQQVITRFLEVLGHTDVDVASDGQEAQERLAERDYDLVLMDLQMPQRDGIEVVHWLRARDDSAPNARAPVIALTANATAQIVERCQAAGMNDYLNKPVTLARLAAMLDTWLPARSRAARLPVVKAAS
ncbi:MAG: ATP-binding protein [Nannocystaceae bacterium]